MGTMDKERKVQGRWRKRLLAAVLAGCVMPAGPLPQAGAETAGHVVISEVFGGGGSSGAAYRHDYVELYNPTEKAVTLDNWSVQYASATGTTWQKTELSGSIPPHGYFLIREGGGSDGASLPAPDASGGIAMKATQGKVALVSHSQLLSGADPAGQPGVIDFVGYGSTNAAEGGSPAPAPSVVTSVSRKSSASAVVPGEGNGWDTDQNGSDFVAGEPTPKHSRSPAEPPLDNGSDPGKVPAVTAQPPGPAVSAGTLVKLTTPLEGAVIHYTLDGTEPTTASPVYQQPIAVAEPLTIKALAVKDGWTASDVAVYSYTIQADVVRIHDIQGASHASPYTGVTVANVEGIVTAVAAGGSGTTGFYMQDPEPDSDPRTSEGLYVYEPNARVKAGDRVQVSGIVKEYVSKSRQETDLTLTEIDATSVRVLASDQPLPAPVVLGEGAYSFPHRVIDNDSFARFDPEEDGIDFWESVEGMLVQVNHPRVVGATETFANPPSAEFVIVADGANPDEVRTPAGGVAIAEDSYNPERITVADKLVAGAPAAKVGDTFAGPIVGVIDYSFANYKLYNTEPLPALVNGGHEREVTALEPQADRVTIASYNIENFSARADAEKVRRIADSIVGNLKRPDILGLIEMQDNSGPQDDGVTDASQSAQVLIDAVAKRGGPAYRYVDIAPEDKRDGGQPGGNIRVGFLYNPERVRLAERPAGDAVTAVLVETEQGMARLSYNPGRIDPANPAFANSRKPLAAEFWFGDKPLIVIANHFNSKGGDGPLFGVRQPPVLASEAQRVEIAKAVNGFVRDIHAADPQANVVVLGDLNDFPFSRPLRTLEGDVLRNMVETLPAGERYTYVYQGNSQALDHILVSRHLAERTTVDIVHINADFTGEQGRASDHDPVLVQIDLPERNGGQSPDVRALIVRERHVKLRPGSEVRLQVAAVLGKGGRRDVTTECVYTSSEPDLVAVSPEGVIRAADHVKNNDRAVLTVSYGGQTAQVQVTVTGEAK